MMIRRPGSAADQRDRALIVSGFAKPGCLEASDTAFSGQGERRRVTGRVDRLHIADVAVSVGGGWAVIGDVEWIMGGHCGAGDQWGTPRLGCR